MLRASEVARWGTRMENKRDEELMERSSECSESQGNGAAPNGTAWSSLAVTVRSRREGANGEDRPWVLICSEKRRCGCVSDD